MIDEVSLIAQTPSMASITIRKLQETTKARLRVRAAQHGRSMEDEARDILRQALAQQRTAPRNLAETIHRRFSARGGVELALEAREALREPPTFGR